MRKIDKPLDLPEEVFRICISHIQNVDLKSRLELCEPAIIAASHEMETKAILSDLHSIATSENVSGLVTGKEMERVYTDRMAKKNSPGRPFYDRLISTPAHGRCPLCGQRIVSTLDHHLPKAFYPALAVAPLNLVPSCRDCNTIKINSIPRTAEQETLHPYFDNVNDDIWLKCYVVEESPASVIFYVDPPAYWADLLSKRVKHHFEILKLASLYGSHSADELSSIRYSLRKLLSSGGKESVFSFLQDAAASKAAGLPKNSWQTAFYVGLANNDWFCEGGFDS